MKKLSKELKDAIIKDIQAGLKISEIAKKYSISRVTVYRIYEEYKLSQASQGAQVPYSPADASGISDQLNNALAMREDLKLLQINPERRPILEAVVKNLAWWQEAIQRIGWHAVLLAFQARRLDIDNIEAELKSFKNADEFVRFIDEYLVALLKAQANAEALITAEKRRKAAEAYATFVEMERDKLQQNVQRLTNLLNIALTYVPKEKMQQLLLGSALMTGFSNNANDEGEAK